MIIDQQSVHVNWCRPKHKRSQEGLARLDIQEISAGTKNVSTNRIRKNDVALDDQISVADSPGTLFSWSVSSVVSARTKHLYSSHIIANIDDHRRLSHLSRFFAFHRNYCRCPQNVACLGVHVRVNCERRRQRSPEMMLECVCVRQFSRLAKRCGRPSALGTSA